MRDANQDKEYAGITGLPLYCKSAIGLALGQDNQVLKDGLVRANTGCVVFYIFKILK